MMQRRFARWGVSTLGICLVVLVISSANAQPARSGAAGRTAPSDRAAEEQRRRSGVDEPYKPGPLSTRKANVPKGNVTEHTFKDSKVFPGTVRKYWVYVPDQYDGETPLALMVFQDGQNYMNENGSYRIPIVLDNLIASKDLPPMAAVFINPGEIPRDNGEPIRNRSVEYDTLSDAYAKLVIDEILPLVEKDVKLTDDPKMRAIGGASSGGICAFTVAWERPDYFTRVHSNIGSFVNIRGGHNYEAMIRKTDKKPIKVFLQDGTNDLDNEHGNWPLANQQMAKALEFKGYEHKLVMGVGGHNGRHGGQIMPEALKWLWSDVSPKRPAGR